MGSSLRALVLVARCSHSGARQVAGEGSWASCWDVATSLGGHFWLRGMPFGATEKFLITVETTNSDTLDVASDQPLKTRYMLYSYTLDLKLGR